MALRGLGMTAALLLTALPPAPIRSEVALWQDGARSNNPPERLPGLPDFTRLAQRATAAVVSISTLQQLDQDDPVRDLLDPKGSETQKGLGSGFFIHPAGFLITNAHVVEGATQVTVSVGAGTRSRDYPARIIGSDKPTDVALLKIEPADGETFSPLPLGNSDGVQVAEWVAAVGSPFGLSHSVTVGVVSYKGRNDVMPAGRDGYYDFLQTDAPINPGSSGGPLINTRGEVVGITNAVNAVGQGIGFAIPINMAKQVLVPLLKEGKVRRSWLGITVVNLTPELNRTFKVPEKSSGVLVSDVHRGGPGDRAGIKLGDVITSFDGMRIDDAQHLRWLSAIAGTGKKVAIDYERRGEARHAVISLESMPENEPAAGYSQPTELGLAVRPVDVPVARSSGLALPLGALVREVRPGSPADKAGVLPGDVVLKIDDLAIRSPASIARAVSHVQSGRLARLVVRRGEKTLFLSVKKP